MGWGGIDSEISIEVGECLVSDVLGLSLHRIVVTFINFTICIALRSTLVMLERWQGIELPLEVCMSSYKDFKRYLC